MQSVGPSTSPQTKDVRCRPTGHQMARIAPEISGGNPGANRKKRHPPHPRVSAAETSPSPCDQTSEAPPQGPWADSVQCTAKSLRDTSGTTPGELRQRGLMSRRCRPSTARHMSAPHAVLCRHNDRGPAAKGRGRSHEPCVARVTVRLCPMEQQDNAPTQGPPGVAGTAPRVSAPPPPPCDIPSGCCFFTGPWTVTRSSLRMLRRGAAFCRPLRPVLPLVSFPRSRSPVVGVLGLC